MENFTTGIIFIVAAIAVYAERKKKGRQKEGTKGQANEMESSSSIKLHMCSERV
jgi:hypothetical protein